MNRYFDLSRPDNTLDIGIGHCNPNTELMTELFRQVNIETYIHFVVLPKEIMKGVVSPNRYRHKVFGVRLNTLFRIMGKSLEARSKFYLDKLRQQYSENGSS